MNKTLISGTNVSTHIQTIMHVFNELTKML